MAERRATTSEPPRDPFHRPPGHERQIDRDIDVRKVSWTVIAILVLTLVSMAAMWGLLTVLEGRAERTAPEVPALRLQAAEEAPPGPRLQSAPERDLIEMRAEETEILTTYGWSDREAGTVRVPIERAMEMLAAERGAPAPDTASSAAAEDEAVSTVPLDEAETPGEAGPVQE